MLISSIFYHDLIRESFQTIPSPKHISCHMHYWTSVLPQLTAPEAGPFTPGQPLLHVVKAI
jgi:hypothetical protein